MLWLTSTHSSFVRSFLQYSAGGLTWLIYMNYYLMDGGVEVCCTTVGAHEYDLEIVIVELGLTSVSFVV